MDRDDSPHPRSPGRTYRGAHHIGLSTGRVGYDLESETEAVARARQPIRFVIHHAVAVPDTFSRLVHVFLVPDEAAPRSQNCTTISMPAGCGLTCAQTSPIPHMTHECVDWARPSGWLRVRRPGTCTIHGRITNLHKPPMSVAREFASTSHRLGDVAERRAR